MKPVSNRNVAVIGSGISGLSAAWLLSQHCNVTLFERNAKPGGHSNTQIISVPEGEIAVDTGFIVYNEETYPNLTALFDYLDVPVKQSKMTFSFSLDKGRYEYSGTGLKGLFGQKMNFLNPKHWRMIKDIQRFFSDSRNAIRKYDPGIELSRFLELEGFSKSFLEDHILPMAGAIWSAPADMMKTFPAQSFLDFYANHGLLQIRNRPKWKTVDGGAVQYVTRLLEDSKCDIRTSSAIKSVRRFPTHVLVEEADRTIHRFDDVVFACHADVALELLDADPFERSLLENFKYSDNHAVLHHDVGQLPRRRSVWSSWNYMADRTGTRPVEETCVSYYMNALQDLPTETDVIVTLNPLVPVDASKIFYETSYRHPIFGNRAMEAQKYLWELQGRRNAWFCGSYFGYGFHEDGLQSGLAVAEEMTGAKRPWKVANESGRIHLRQKKPEFMEAAE